MLTGLLYRKLFTLANIVLFGLVIWFVAQTGRSFIRSDEPLEDVNGFHQEETVDNMMLATVEERAVYDMIVNGGIFGGAASQSSDMEIVAPVVQAVQTTEETRLPLTLYGTVVAGANDPLATAIIEVKEGATRVKTFYIGQAVMDRVILREVRPKEIILENQRTNTLEQLSLTKKRTQIAANSVSPLGRRNVASRSSSAPVRTFNKQQIADELRRNYEELASTMDVRVVKDSNGRIQGISASNIERSEVAKKLGFKENDILVSVNNEMIDSVDKVYEIIEKYRNVSIFRVGILRDGRPQYLTYRFN